MDIQHSNIENEDENLIDLVVERHIPSKNIIKNDKRLLEEEFKQSYTNQNSIDITNDINEKRNICVDLPQPVLPQIIIILFSDNFCNIVSL